MAGREVQNLVHTLLPRVQGLPSQRVCWPCDLSPGAPRCGLGSCSWWGVTGVPAAEQKSRAHRQSPSLVQAAWLAPGPGVRRVCSPCFSLAATLPWAGHGSLCLISSRVTC